MLKTLLISVAMSAAILGSSTLVYVNETSPHRSEQAAPVEDRGAPSGPAAPAPPAAAPSRSRERATPTWAANLDP